jgi:uncharacterized protein YecE (DUF72 family)
MRFFVGTSGYSYREWKGSFYPQTLLKPDMLRYYSERFAAVEINGSFYRMPKASVLKSWAEEVPRGFQFAFKAPRSITHFKRLQDAQNVAEQFCDVTAFLQAHQGPLLFGLPPNFQKDVPRLKAFLRELGRRARVAFEFHHASWFDKEVFDCLRANRCALCTSDEAEASWTKLVRTTDWGYVRLRRKTYTNDRLSGWIKRIKAQKWREAYVFFKHEETGAGPKLAARFLKLAGQ